MGFWSRLFGAAFGAQAKEALPYGSLAPFIEVYGSQRAKSGQSVTYWTALQVPAVLACVRVLAEGIAQTPLKLHRARAEGQGSDPAIDHPLYALLYRQPNPWQTSFGFRETMMLHTVMCGNFFAFKNRAGRAIRELIPIDPTHVEVVRTTSDMLPEYWVRNDRGERRQIPRDAIWHVQGPSWNSWMGLEAVKVARDAIGLAMAIDADQSDLYKNGVRASGIYSVENTLTEQQYKDLRKFIKEFQTDETGGPLILDRNAKFQQLTMSSVDAQTLEMRRLQIEEICRVFRVMPIMIGHADKTATYASAEQMFLQHVVHTLAPWCVRIEQAIDNDLLTEADRETGVYAKFNLNGLMRGAFADRMTGYSKALGAGGSPAWMTPNEIRALEEMNPVAGGDDLPQPTQSAPAADTPASGG